VVNILQNYSHAIYIFIGSRQKVTYAMHDTTLYCV